MEEEIQTTVCRYSSSRDSQVSKIKTFLSGNDFLQFPYKS